MYRIPVRTDDGQQVTVEHISTLEHLLECKDFLYEGWGKLQEKSVGNGNVTWDEFMQLVVAVALSPEAEGTVLVMRSKNEKPLLFMVAYNDSVTSREHCLFIYAGYSTGRCQAATTAAWMYLHSWAKDRGFMKLRAQSRRLNGAAMRWFKRKLGFRPTALMFEKEI